MAEQPIAFSFTVDSFYISQTRSRHEDTDFVSCTLQMQNADGTTAPSQTLTKSMGNVNNGVHSVVLTFPNVLVSPGQTVLWSYSIVNAGNAPLSKVESGAVSVGNGILSALVKGLIPAAAAGTTLSLLTLGGAAAAALASVLATSLEGMLTANCDGPVAAEAHTFTYDQLVAGPVQAGFFTQHPGVNSASGCGENSNYWVSYHVDNGPYKAFSGGSFASIPTHNGPALKLD